LVFTFLSAGPFGPLMLFDAFGGYVFLIFHFRPSGRVSPYSLLTPAAQRSCFFSSFFDASGGVLGHHVSFPLLFPHSLLVLNCSPPTPSCEPRVGSGISPSFARLSCSHYTSVGCCSNPPYVGFEPVFPDQYTPGVGSPEMCPFR